MRWGGNRESENVEDRRGGGGGGFPMRIGGLGAIVILIGGLLLGVDPATLMSLLNGDQPPQQTQQQAGRQTQPGYDTGSGYDTGNGSSRPPQAEHQANRDDPLKRFVSVVLADTEDVWKQVFRTAGRTYEEPKLVLFTNRIDSACGMASTASGPFYCPNDQKVYLDLAFFEEMKNRFHAPGEFAEAYVIAHEIGHHVQNSLGILQEATNQRRRSDERRSNEISVRLELQADCLAGVWANHADRMKHIIEQGDVEAAMNAAAAVGDDRLQRQSRGVVVPDAFTHGSSAQRVRWFKQGLQTGSTKQCDTFAANSP
jgi:predicted metalloprotease